MDLFVADGLIVAAVFIFAGWVLHRKWRVMPKAMRGTWIVILLFPLLYSLFAGVLDSLQFGITTGMANIPVYASSIYLLAIFYPIGIAWLIAIVVLSIVTLQRVRLKRG